MPKISVQLILHVGVLILYVLALWFWQVANFTSLTDLCQTCVGYFNACHLSNPPCRLAALLISRFILDLQGTIHSEELATADETPTLRFASDPIMGHLGSRVGATPAWVSTADRKSVV